MVGNRRRESENIDCLHMARALALAERGRGRTSPNPMVGALVVDDEGVVVGRGFHEAAGGPHAEIHALAEAGGRARGATLYCTLEPCSHTGRTGPCAPRVVDAGIRRVVVAVQDPNPVVSGRGFAHLRAHGLDVAVGLLSGEAERLNAPFFTVMRQHRPFITMKVALSRDGCVAARPGVRTPLTGPSANRLVHRERAEVDAVAVGSGTVLADDPLLTPRGAYRHRPLTRVVFDRSLRTPPTARLFSTLQVGAVILVSALPDRAGQERTKVLRSAGARVECIDGDAGNWLAAAVARLSRFGVNSVVLEGGPTLHAAAWTAGIVDRVQVFQTPCQLGPGGVPWFEDASFLLDQLDGVTTTVLGEDVLIEGHVHRPD